MVAVSLSGLPVTFSSPENVPAPSVYSISVSSLLSMPSPVTIILRMSLSDSVKQGDIMGLPPSVPSLKPILVSLLLD